MKRISTWLAVALAIVAMGGAYGISRLGEDSPGGAPASAQTSSSSSSTSTKPDDGRTGGTPDEHTDKPGENK
jgi:hypothetical protein